MKNTQTHAAQTHILQAVILDALHLIGRPCRRSELAGTAELTIKKLSIPLQLLVTSGTVVKMEDGSYSIPAARSQRHLRAS